MNLTVSEVVAAVRRAAEQDSDWQAQACEVAMLPAVEAAWRALNKGRALSVTVIPGLPHKGEGFTREQNLARCAAGKWNEVSGYIFDPGLAGLVWSRVSADHYGHSAHVAWEGVCRETYHAVIEVARDLGLEALRGPLSEQVLRTYTTRLGFYGITLVDA